MAAVLSTTVTAWPKLGLERKVQVTIQIQSNECHPASSEPILAAVPFDDMSDLTPVCVSANIQPFFQGSYNC